MDPSPYLPYIPAYKMTLKVEKRLVQLNRSSYTTDIKVFMVYKTDIILYLVLSDGRLIRQDIRVDVFQKYSKK